MKILQVLLVGFKLFENIGSFRYGGPRSYCIVRMEKIAIRATFVRLRRFLFCCWMVILHVLGIAVGIRFKFVSIGCSIGCHFREFLDSKWCSLFIGKVDGHCNCWE